MWPVHVSGPRSWTRHWAVAPVSRFVIVTMVPNGRVRWAHVPGPGPVPYQVADPLENAGGAAVPLATIWATGAEICSEPTFSRCITVPSSRVVIL